MKQQLKAYYRLTKPGIIYGNMLAAIAGFFFAAKGNPDWLLFFSLVIGLSLVIASACVFNNIHDSSIDSRMKRTMKRSLVTHEISIRSALVYGTVLLVLGTTILIVFTNQLATIVALIGHVAYVVLYGWAKRNTVHSTLIGTISGSTPPVIGYVAVTNQLDTTALILFLILVAWQMPHFYAIAIFRRDEYAQANLPILSVVRGYESTRRQIIVYTVLFLVSCMVLGIYGGASLMWTLIMGLIGAYWLYLILQKSEDPVKWARKQFGWSLMTLLVLCISLSVDSFMH